MQEWTELGTSRYQDHVVAHVLGTTALGYFIIDDAAYVLLDIALIWTIYTGGEMDLMTQAAVIKDLEVEESIRAELAADAEQLHKGEAQALARMTPAPAGCLIVDVKIYAQGERRRILLRGEQSSLHVESLPEQGRIKVLISDENSNQ
jgi:hypothetical protein